MAGIEIMFLVFPRCCFLQLYRSFLIQFCFQKITTIFNRSVWKKINFKLKPGLYRLVKHSITATIKVYLISFHVNDIMDEISILIQWLILNMKLHLYLVKKTFVPKKITKSLKQLFQSMITENLKVTYSQLKTS